MIIDCKKYCYSLSLIFLFVVIAFGNLFRIIVGDYLLYTEALLYFFCSLSAFFLRFERHFWSFCILTSAIIFASFLHGVLLHDYDSVALFYCVRLSFLFLSTIVLAHIFLERFQKDLFEFFAWMLKGYFLAFLLGYSIYLFLPKTEDLILILQMTNSNFNVDPHVNRFISVYLDPNLYAIIACIPFLLSNAMYGQTKKKRYLIAKYLFAISIFLTNSRTGIAEFLLLIFFMMGIRLLKKKIVFSLKGILLLAVTFFILLLQNSFGAFLDRLSRIFHDKSAWFRWISVQDTFELIKDNLLLGIGYNYVKKVYYVDSSLLFIAVCFGLVGLLVAVFFGGLYLLNLGRHVRGIQNPVIQEFGYYFLFYLCSTILFASCFTNILFFIFWLIPVCVISIILHAQKINVPVSVPVPVPEK